MGGPLTPPPTPTTTPQFGVAVGWGVSPNPHLRGDAAGGAEAAFVVWFPICCRVHELGSIERGLRGDKGTWGGGLGGVYGAGAPRRLQHRCFPARLQPNKSSVRLQVLIYCPYSSAPPPNPTVPFLLGGGGGLQP